MGTAVAAGAAAAGLLGAAPAGAATLFEVDSTLDERDRTLNGVCESTPSNACTLRAAVAEVNGVFGRGVIEIPAGTYVLRLGDIDLTASPTISGAGAGRTILDGGGVDRVFEVRDGGFAYVEDVTIRGGKGGPSSVFPGHVHGGGVHNHGQLILVRSTLVDNRAPTGGGITNAGTGILTLVDNTITSNGADAHGGGFENLGQATLANVTISHNSGSNGFFSTKSVRLNNTIVADNAGANCGGTGPLEGAGSGHNLDSGSSCNLSAPGDLTSRNPLLGPLAFDGTRTPAAGSPAIDAGDSTPANCSRKDARGVPRPQDGNGDGAAACDMGAVEVIRTLRLTTPHMTGDDVRWAELRLNFHGAGPLEVDGDYGPGTAATVRRFQGQKGLAVTGEVGPETYAALGARPRTLRLTDPHMQGDDIRWVEQRLNHHHPGAVAVDGDYGPGTAAAVRAFQSAKGMTVTGEVTLSTYEALGRAG
jgi:peptidoglycan hydrolase-like protein with peptidoglycan-binding domain